MTLSAVLSSESVSRPRHERRLHEVTKKLAIPRGITCTDWGPVRDTARDKLGVEFDGWQDGMGSLLLSKPTPNSMFSHTVGGFHLSSMRQIGKALGLLTSLLTVNRGWTTMGEVVVGDQVFHPSGRPVTVTEVHPVILNHDCYEVTTSDNRKVIADGEHLWTVQDKRLGGAPWRNMSTREMYEGGLSRALEGSRTVTTDGKQYRTTEYRFTLPRQEALEAMPSSELPLEPYLLGAWLGNGDATSASLTSGDQDIAHWEAAISAAGYDPRSTFQQGKLGCGWHTSIQDTGNSSRGLRSFQAALREMNLIKNKHIPPEYLIGSTDQRLALLQGLLDTDGHITKQAGTIEFCSMTKDLADGVLFLARSLGWRATVKEGKAKLDGRDYGIKYRVTFTPKASDEFTPFRLQRKIDRIGTTDGGKGRFTVSIKSIEPVASEPVRCIKVASDDGLFLAGRDLIVTHNTYFGAGALFAMCVEYPGLLVIWSAHHSATHDETFGSMLEFAARRKIEPFIAQTFTGSGDEEIRFHNGSRILFGARERGFGRGIPGVDVFVYDEGQILSERAMQNTLATLNTSDVGLHVYFGTPPMKEEIHKAGAWMRAREIGWAGGKDGPMQVETEDTVWIEIGAPDDADPDSPETWLCNPSHPHRTPVQAFLRLRRKLNDEGWLHEGLGVYDSDEGSIFDIGRWNKLAIEEADPPDRAVVVIDVSPDAKWGCVATASHLPVNSDAEVEKTLVMVKSYKGMAGIAADIIKMSDEGKIDELAITGGAARALETDLVDLEFDVMKQSEMSAAYANLKKCIEDGSVAHLAQEQLNVAMVNAKSRYLQTGEAQAFDRREYSVDVSPAVAVAAALYRYGLGEGMPLIM